MSRFMNPRGTLAAVVATATAMVSPSAVAASRPAKQHQRCGSGGLPVTVDARPECLSHRLLAGALRSAGSVDAAARESDTPWLGRSPPCSRRVLLMEQTAGSRWWR
jgi:hypothetical protein